MFQDTTLMNESTSLIAIEQFLEDVYNEYYIHDDEEFKHQLIEAVLVFKLVHREDLTYCHVVRIMKRVLILVDYALEKLELHAYEDILKFEHHHVFHIQSMVRDEMKSALCERVDFKRREECNAKKLEGYLNQLLTHYSRLLFVRVDLSILQEYQDNWDIENFSMALAILRNRIANQDGCFSDLQGYAWALEQGVKKGYHCHLLLIYDGNEHKEDSALAKMVGQYWEVITMNQGTSYNCNRKENIRKFEINGMLGIGMIHRDQPLQVNNAIRTAMYLANPDKKGQHMRVKTSPQMKTFGIGQFNVGWRRGLKEYSF
ncbi:inovirus-type Gp2 protein [Acinetobacter baumannii]|uniref:YagK/YfjJ domain-containing protein n=1 Tax=Acinetobacter baumannii TaxID=470 RepID=UPI0002BB4188|nr:inovirus-type Gp2 protein [Acinetobacter baumannii]